MTGAEVDRLYPWQIAVPDSVIIHSWVRPSIGACDRGHSVFYDEQWWNVVCFETREQAEVFGRKVDGCWFNPKERGRGNSWARWTPKQKPLTFSQLDDMKEHAMCNLYSHTSSRQAIIDLAKAWRIAENIGNLEPQPGIFPDYSAPIVRNFQGERS